MSTLETLVWMAALAAMLVVLLAIVWWLWPLRTGQMMRCPATGSIAFVRVESVRRSADGPPEPRVRQCDLWPLAGPCDRGCLQRYAETEGTRFNVAALRPFEHP